MKIIFALILPFFLLSCATKSTQKMQESNITYEAMSRGLFMKAEIKGNKMTVVRDRNSEPVACVLGENDLKELEKLFQEVNLKEMESYKAPTEKRFYDGAAIANLQVEFQGQNYKTQDFDHGTPPVELATFINKIVSLSEK